MSPERSILFYARLAAESARKQQPLGQTKFHLLTGIAATRAGYPHVGAHCREILAKIAPHHAINRFGTFADALRDDDFSLIARQLERWCPPERAEHLAAQLGGVDANGEQADIDEESIIAMLTQDPAK